jgi:hypothetical protein
MTDPLVAGHVGSKGAECRLEIQRTEKGTGGKGLKGDQGSVNQMETNQSRQAAELTPRRPQGPMGSYWLIAKNQNNRMEVFTLCSDDQREILPVFSFEEEAEMFLRFRGAEKGWRVRESSGGELISVLYGPCAGVTEVALDPSPEMVVERTAGLVSLHRDCFVDLVVVRAREPSSLWGPEA